MEDGPCALVIRNEQEVHLEHLLMGSSGALERHPVASVVRLLAMLAVGACLKREPCEAEVQDQPLVHLLQQMFA